jgi:hypothetical protein
VSFISNDNRCASGLRGDQINNDALNGPFFNQLRCKARPPLQILPRKYLEPVFVNVTGTVNAMFSTSWNRRWGQTVEKSLWLSLSCSL